MEKFIKRFLFFGFISFLGYMVLTLYTKIKAAINLEKSLPEYLKSVYDTEVETDIRIAFRNYTITIICSQELLDKKEVVQKTVADYLYDFYPELNEKYVNILFKLKEVSTEE